MIFQGIDIFRVQWLQMGGDIGYMMRAVDDAIASVRSGLPR